MKKKLLFFPLLFMFAFFVLWACKHEPVEMAGPTPPDPVLCDTLDITYNGDVYPIFDQYCVFCHGGAIPDGGIDLTNYEDVAMIAQSGQLVGSINHATSYSPMPQNADKLDFCRIRTITIWVNDTIFPAPGHPCDPDTVYFERDLLPLLQSSCAQSGCHDAITMQDGVRITDYISIMETADVDPYNPGESKLYKVIIEDEPQDRMPPPPAPAMSSEDIALVNKWITQGAQNLFCDEEECDTTNISYSAPVSGIIQNHCLGCHNDNSPQGGISLEGYDNLVIVAADGRLMGSVKHKIGYQPMPQNSAQLSDCKIQQLEIWTNNGTPQ